METLPRAGYPRPDFVRPEWTCLNGSWFFAEDDAMEKTDAEMLSAESLPLTITVPFCRESRLSGLAHTGFCRRVWYKRTCSVPASYLGAGKRVLLHIGACDYRTKVWVNDAFVGEHIGGMNAFSFDITEALGQKTDAVITVCATDLPLDGGQCCGKQSFREESFGCFYTRTTGIWQSVWLESVPSAYLRSIRVLPSLTDGKITLEARTVGADSLPLTVRASYHGKPMGEMRATVRGNHASGEILLSEIHAWDVGKGELYDLTLTLGEDTVTSYFGLRDIAVKDGIFFLNGRPVFQRLVLDQGFYPDGVWTAPTDGDLKADIDRSTAMGFNGARLHQKVFEPRFLYECDKAGYLVWGEHGNWGLDLSRPTAFGGMFPDWIEILERDFNHPAVIGWCPLNETEQNQNPDFVRALVSLTHALDPTRPVIDTSGWCHIDGLSDLPDAHNYTQDPAAFAAVWEPLTEGKPIELYPESWEQRQQAVISFVSEYGGIRWVEGEANGWGYGEAPKSGEEFIARFKGLTEALLRHPKLTALCYTQLTDVEQEMNGLYTFDRRPKFDPTIFHAILAQKAEIER